MENSSRNLGNFLIISIVIAVIFSFSFLYINYKKEKDFQKNISFSRLNTIIQKDSINDVLIAKLYKLRKASTKEVYPLSSDTIFNKNLSFLLTDRLNDILLGQRDFEHIDRSTIHYITSYFDYYSFDYNFNHEELIKYKYQFIDSLVSDKFILNTYNLYKPALFDVWYKLWNNQRQVDLETIDCAIDFFSNYDKQKAFEFYKLHCKDSTFVTVDYRGIREPDRKFNAQLERLIYQHKVMTPKRILKWLLFLRKEIDKYEYVRN
jgi:hypothetical protein